MYASAPLLVVSLSGCSRTVTLASVARVFPTCDSRSPCVGHGCAVPDPWASSTGSARRSRALHTLPLQPSHRCPRFGHAEKDGGSEVDDAEHTADEHRLRHMVQRQMRRDAL